ncbi:MAG: tetratricopeptide repeat protein [Prevotellaceae bacterium]|nr:tetratricopeptide repeat protein [Prevotellaceae bacterium]MDY3857054.1 tetratricopeptide repeat protein [Bacteroidaceae bacterium]
MNIDEILMQLRQGHVDAVIQQIEHIIADLTSSTTDQKPTDVQVDQLYYLLGKAYQKQGNWQLAINNYLEAISINPQSPAQQALEIANQILDFYCKDIYGQ